MKNLRKLFANITRPKVLKALIAVVVFILAVAGYLYFQKTTARIKIDNSLIQAPVISITPQIPESIKKLYVYEGQTVSKGDNLADAGDETIHAPSDGLVIQTNNSIGSLVSSQNPIVQMVNPFDLRVEGAVDENKGLKDLKIGQVVSFTIDAFPKKTYWGYIDEISQTTKQTGISFSISSERPTRQFEVFAKFDTKKYPEIKNGMSAKMSVFTRMP